jgi:hypothetical protein
MVIASAGPTTKKVRSCMVPVSHKYSGFIYRETSKEPELFIAIVYGNGPLIIPTCEELGSQRAVSRLNFPKTS